MGNPFRGRWTRSRTNAASAAGSRTSANRTSPATCALADLPLARLQVPVLNGVLVLLRLAVLGLGPAAACPRVGESLDTRVHVKVSAGSARSRRASMPQ